MTKEGLFEQGGYLLEAEEAQGDATRDSALRYRHCEADFGIWGSRPSLKFWDLGRGEFGIWMLCYAVIRFGSWLCIPSWYPIAIGRGVGMCISDFGKAERVFDMGFGCRLTRNSDFGSRKSDPWMNSEFGFWAQLCQAGSTTGADFR
jgi:hypothetical protein